jgi:hypothetical protein
VPETPAREVIAAALNVPDTPEMNETELVLLMLAGSATPEKARARASGCGSGSVKKTDTPQLPFDPSERDGWS